VIFGRRVVNRGDREARLLILRENSRIEIDHRPYPRKEDERPKKPPQ
jgi:hypothetical protein